MCPIEQVVESVFGALPCDVHMYGSHLSGLADADADVDFTIEVGVTEQEALELLRGVSEECENFDFVVLELAENVPSPSSKAEKSEKKRKPERYSLPEGGEGRYQQVLNGSLSAVLKPMFASAQ